MVRYLPRKRSDSQPPSRGKKYTPITKTWKTSLAAASRSFAATPARMAEDTRNWVRMLRMP